MSTQDIHAMPITLTEAAIAHLRNQFKKHPGAKGLRIKIKTTGCSGKSYQPELADHILPDELTFAVAPDVNIFVNPDDFLLYLKGLNIDYVKEGLNSGFKYINPNEKGSCGCGESFTI